MIRKHRTSGSDVRAEALVGDVGDGPAVIVDDMISTGGTIMATAGLLRAQCPATELMVAATHGPLTDRTTPR